MTVSAIGWVLIAILAAVPVMAQTPALPAALPAALPPDQNAPGDQQWPLHIDTPSGAITVYQPQMTNFDGDKLSARAAVSVVPPGQQDPIFGALWMDSRVSTDRVARTVQILDITVTKARFPDTPAGANAPTDQQLTDVLRTTLPKQPMTLSLDQLTAMMQVVDKEKAAVKDISTSPPKVIFRPHASVLVQFDGDPRLEQAENSNLMRVVNTPFFIVLDPQSKSYFLKGGGQWFSAPNPLGPYQSTGGAPQPISALADSTGYKDPQQALSPAQAAGIEIITATEPSELIWTDGPEQMSTLNNTSLLYVANTDCDIFLDIDNQQIYICVSGRWFTAPHKTGPWAYVAPDKLPADFSRIEPQSPKGEVLAHIANTQAAKDAVADTYVPQTAAINRTDFQQPDVQYDGDPQFQPVQDTACSYAVNTPQSIVLCDNQYYCCSNAVWYVGHGPRGPWGLCDRVPETIYTIPPSCPIYPCRYVYVYDVTPDVVYCGYLPGYVGCYHYDGVVVYGTGYVYHPWIGHEFYPRPYTYGFAAHYDDYQNHWGFSVGLAFGSGAAWVGGGREFEPRHDEWFGHGGYRPAIIENRTTNIYRTNITNVNINRTVVHDTQYNVYDRRKDVRVDIHDRPEVRTPSRDAQARGGDRNGDRSVDHAAEMPHTPERPAAGRSPGHDDVFADKDGNVYRRGNDGGWEKRANNQWSKSEPTHAAEPSKTAEPSKAIEPSRSVEPAHVDTGRTVEPSRSAEPSHAEPSKSEPAKSEPTERTSHADIDRDYQARQEGEDRASRSSRDSSASSGHADRSSDSKGGGDSRGGGGSDRSGGSSERGGGGGNSGAGNAGSGGGNGGAGARGH